MPVIATLFEEHANEVVTPEVSQCFHLDAVVCVVDVRSANNIGATVHDARQLAFADVVVVTHTSPEAAAAASAADAKSLASQQGAGEATEETGNGKATGKGKKGKGKGGSGGGAHTSTELTTSGSAGASGATGSDAASSAGAGQHSTQLPAHAREQICGINPLVQIKELPQLDTLLRTPQSLALSLSQNGSQAGDKLKNMHAEAATGGAAEDDLSKSIVPAGGSTSEGQDDDDVRTHSSVLPAFPDLHPIPRSRSSSAAALVPSHTIPHPLSSVHPMGLRRWRKKWT